MVVVGVNMDLTGTSALLLLVNCSERVRDTGNVGSASVGAKLCSKLSFLKLVVFPPAE